MIRHIVYFTVKEGVDKEIVFQGLSLLVGIPHRLHLEVGRNLRTDTISPGGPDFVVHGEFADQAQLAAYKAHPLYQQSISIVRPLRDLRMAADFFVGPMTPLGPQAVSSDHQIDELWENHRESSL